MITIAYKDGTHITPKRYGTPWSSSCIDKWKNICADKWKKILFQRTNTEVKEIACVALHLFWWQYGMKSLGKE